MKKGMLLIVVICFTFLFGSSVAQKPLIDINVKSWNGVGKYLISDNGQYIAYNISDTSGESLFIRSTLSAWQITVPRALLIGITQDSRKVVFRLGDSVGMADLKEPNELVYLKNIKSFQFVKRGNDNDLLIYTVKQRPDQLILREVESAKEKSYSRVEAFWLSDDGNVVVLEVIKKDSNTVKYELDWFDVAKNEVRTIWEGRKIQDLKIGHSDMQCVFTIMNSDNSNRNDIWDYRNIDEKASMVLDGESEPLKGMIINGIIDFNDEDSRIFINLTEPKINKQVGSGSVPVDIWNYKDSILQSQQLWILKNQHNSSIQYKAIFNIPNRRLVRLEYENEKVTSRIYNDKAMNYVLLMKSGGGTSSEWNWNNMSRIAVYLVDLDNGSRRLIAAKLPNAGLYSYELSYKENYIYYYDPESKGYFIYRICDSTRKDMTLGIQGRWEEEAQTDEPDGSYLSYSMAGFIKNTDAILVYDQNDIFELDPTGKLLAKNLTKIEVKSHNFIFRLLGSIGKPVLDSNASVCLSVFNRANKEASLARFSIKSALPVRTLNFEPYYFNSRLPLKARDTDVYVVVRMSAEKFPNLFFTSDFRKYDPITDIHPERPYNWLTTELVTWKTFDGKLDQGILYKPENFNPRRKYPLLVYYYERSSDDLHKFLTPGLSSGLLNIPYYVSRDYLVFEPDIHYKVGWPGRSAYNCIVSGVKYLAKRSYVDVKRMGLQGHSFGGFETNYIITHSELFAAAMSSSGMSDFVSAYGSVIGDGSSRQRQYELTRDRIGTTLWEKPDLYIENSPVFRADKVTTPLLMMTNYADGDVPCQQGIEFFTALRRLGKKAWMLQYDGEGHQVFSKAAQEDLTIRMAQFFNYYLKGEPPPRWMTIGVPATLKGIDSGLEIDSTGGKP